MPAHGGLGEHESLLASLYGIRMQTKPGNSGRVSRIMATALGTAASPLTRKPRGTAQDHPQAFDFLLGSIPARLGMGRHHKRRQ